MKRYFSIILFFFSLFISLVLLLSFVNLIYSTYRVNNKIDHDRVWDRLEQYCNTEKAEVSLGKDDEKVILEYKHKAYPFLDFCRKIEFNHSSEDFVIYVYGSSPLVSRPPVIGRRYRHFSEILESKLNSRIQEKKFKIYNLAMKWADSYALKEIIEKTVDYSEPDLAVFYYEGGVDYELAYRAARIKEDYYLLKSGLLRRILTPRFLDNVPGWKIVVEYGNWFMNGYLEPALINLVQKLRLVKIDPVPFESYNGLILDRFERNIKHMVNYMDGRGVPLVIVTCLDNLEARPFGVVEITDKLYRKGMEQENYEKKMEYLVRAKDSEIFTEDIRAKTEAYEFLRSLEDLNLSNIFVFDLRRKLFNERIGFDFNYFYDYGHLRPKANRLIAENLYNYLIRENLIGRGYE